MVYKHRKYLNYVIISPLTGTYVVKMAARGKLLHLQLQLLILLINDGSLTCSVINIATTLHKRGQTEGQY